MPEVTLLDDGRVRLNEPYRCVISNTPEKLNIITVPAGFVSNGASIPRCLWRFLGHPYEFGHAEPAIVHDFLCDTAADRNERLLGDATFRLLLARHGVPRWKQCVFWLGVYLQGRFLWVPKLPLAIVVVALFLALFGAIPPTTDKETPFKLTAGGKTVWVRHSEHAGRFHFATEPKPKKPLPEPRIVIGSCEFVRAKDADTYVISVTREVNVRADKCWAPETKEIRRANHVSQKTLGLEALAALQEIAKPGDKCRLEVLPDGDKDIGDGLTFGRVVGAVYLEDGDGRSLGEVLNQKGLTFETKAELEAYLTERDTDERFVQ